MSLLPKKKTDREYAKEFAIGQFLNRRSEASQCPQVNNGDLVAGSPMYFYCKDCGVQTDVLPEDYLFRPRLQCSQCNGLQEEGWLEEAKQS